MNGGVLSAGVSAFGYDFGKMWDPVPNLCELSWVIANGPFYDYFVELD